MTAQLNFNLDEIDDKTKFEMIGKVDDYYGALFDISNYIRSELKYEDGESIDKQKMSDKFHEILQEHSIVFRF